MVSIFKNYRFCILMLLIVINIGCAVNERYILSTVGKGVNKKDMSKVSRMIESEKIENHLKALAIKELSKPEHIDPFVNEYLQQLYRAYNTVPVLEKEILNSLMKQKNINNINLLIGLIKSGHQNKELIKNHLIEFGYQGFHLWKTELFTAEGVFRNDIVAMLDKLPGKMNRDVFDLYIQYEQHRDYLSHYLLHFEQETINTIAFNLHENKISSFNTISSLIAVIGAKQLSNYIDLFHNQNEITASIVKDIFTSFSDGAIMSLDKGFESLKSLEARQRLYDVSLIINSTKSLNLLESLINRAELAFDKKHIISNISKMTNQFPEVFISLLDMPDVSIYVIDTFESYLENSPSSVFDTFMKASNVGRNVMLRALILEKRADDKFIKQIFDVFENFDIGVQSYLMYCIMDRQFKNDYRPFLIYSLKHDNRSLYTNALIYCMRYPEIFNDFIVSSFKQITTDNDKKIEVINFFENTPLLSNLSFLYNHFFQEFQVNELIAHQFATIIINTSSIDNIKQLLSQQYNIYATPTLRPNEKKKVDSFLYLISLSRNELLNKTLYIQDLINAYYRYFDLQDKITAINFAGKNSNLKNLNYLLNRYDDLSEIERRVLNSNMNCFKTDVIFSHLQRLASYGDDVDLYIIKDILFSRYTDDTLDDSAKYLLMYIYFRENSFAEASRYIKQYTAINDDIKAIEESIRLWELSESFSLYYKNKVQWNPINFAYVYKSLLEKKIAAKLMQNNPLTSREGQLKYADDLINLDKQINIIRTNYKPYFEIISSRNEYELQSNILISLLNTNYFYEIRSGNTFYKPQDSGIYLELILLLKNVLSEEIIADINSFIVYNDKKSYTPSRLTLAHNRARRYEADYIKSLPPDSETVMTLLYEIPDDNDDLYLTFFDKWNVPIVTPIKVSKIRSDTRQQRD